MAASSASTPSGPPNAHYITTHDPSTGASIFSTIIPTTPSSAGVTPISKQDFLYTTSQHPLHLSPANADIHEFAQQYRDNGLPQGVLTPPGGTGTAIAHIKPGASSPMHRTATIDFGVVIEGVVELELEGKGGARGEVRTMKAGDSIVQRGTMHRWKNVTPDDGWAKLFFVALDIAPGSVVVEGKKLETEFKDL